MAFDHNFARNRRAFTLVELLVVIGVIAVLISLLLPALNLVRRHAKDVNCASNLRQLTAGCVMYQNAYKKLPAALHNGLIGGIIVPSDVQSRLINDLAEFLGYPLVPNTPDWPFGAPFPAPTAAHLPRIALSIEYWDNPELIVGPAIGNGQTYWYTGYSYFGRLDDKPNPWGFINKPENVANARKRGVLWADTLVYWNAPPAHFHANHAAFNGLKQGDHPQGIRGQHVGWSDGSVEWKRLTRDDVNVSVAWTKSSYFLPPSTGYFWWN